MPEWMGGGGWVAPLAVGLPLNQFVGPFEQAQQATTSLNSRTERKIGELLEAGQLTQSQAAEALRTKAGPAWQRAAGLAQDDDANLKFDGMDFASLLASPHLPITWAYQALRGTPERIGPLPGTRQLRALTAALGWGENGAGLNVEAGPRRRLNLPIFDQWEDYRIDRELASMAAGGLLTADQARAAM